MSDVRSSSAGRPIVFWGATGQAKVLAEMLPHLGYRLVALFDNDVSVTSPLSGVSLHHGWEGFQRWRDGTDGLACDFVVAIGGGDAGARLEIFERLEKAGLQPTTLVHPSAYVAKGAAIGPGGQILMGAAVGVDVSIGRTVIVNTKASVDHECVIEDAVHIAPGAVLCGCVRIARGVFVGAGAVVLPRVEIGEGAVVGAGAVVTKSVSPRVVVAGNPARIIRHVEQPTRS